MMKTKQLGWTDLQLTSIGLGTWAMGGGDWSFGWGPQDDHQSIKTIHRALELGINWIDTAPVYGLSHCEEVVGKALQELPSKPMVATKCGRAWDEKRRIFPNLKRDFIYAEVEASLQRLKVDVIDLYQIHWPQPDSDIEEAWTAIAELVEAGKIRYAGVCNFSLTQLQRIQSIHPAASLQPPYSLIERTVEKELLAYCAANKIGVVAYSPMQKGLLTGKINRERIAHFPEDDHRRRDPQFQEPLLSRNLQLADELERMAAKQNHTAAQLAIAWVLRRPEITSAIVGARHPAQVEQIIPAADWTLAPEEINLIENLLDQRPQNLQS
jgi:aryl-alcohol dehydrogenase-like predicted oxidoreductase